MPELLADPSPGEPISPTAPASVLPLSPAATSSLIARVESFYGAAVPFECDFTIANVARRGRSATLRMHLTFARPGRFHASFSTGDVLVVDAQQATLANSTTHQVRQQPVAADYVPMALLHASGRGALSSNVVFSAYPGSAMNAPGFDILSGKPLRAASPITRLVLYVEATGEVRRLLVVDTLGNRQRFDSTGCTPRIPAPPAALFTSSATSLAAQNSPSANLKSPVLGGP